jgi:diacylglycerol kinase
MDYQKLSPRKRLESFLCAVRGIATVLGSQPNTWIMLAAAACVIAAGVWFGIDRLGWALLAVAMLLVLAAEMFNSALEYLTDLVSPEYHPLAKKAKDAAAGAVLLMAILAAILGVIIFVPELL